MGKMLKVLLLKSDRSSIDSIMTPDQWVTSRTSESLIESDEPVHIKYVNFIIKLCLYKIFVNNKKKN